MADNQLTPADERIRTEARDTDWTGLLARVVDDMTRIVHSEFRLLSASMKGALDEEIDRIFAFVATGVLMMVGALCLIAAIIMFLHEFVQLPWWQSFGITGVAMFAIAIVTRAAASRRPPPPAIT
jgi:Putative Actinobacterial Holin-X, holin superfamily III